MGMQSMKKYFKISLAILFFVMFISGCSNTSSNLPTISFNEDTKKNEDKTDVFRSWSHAIGDEEVELEIGEEKTLAVYRETDSNSIQSVDFQNEDTINQMIEQDDGILQKVRKCYARI